MSSTTLQAQVVTKGREALSRATRQAIQALIPTLLVIAGGSTLGIDLEAVAYLAGITALVSVVCSVTGFKLDAGAPVWAQLAERAAKAAAGTALGYLTIDGLVPATVISWQAMVTASVGAAVTSLAMFYTNPPVTAALPMAEDETTFFGDGLSGPFPAQRDGGYTEILVALAVIVLICVVLLLFGVSFK